jgi:hypothetical protein
MDVGYMADEVTEVDRSLFVLSVADIADQWECLYGEDIPAAAIERFERCRFLLERAVWEASAELLEDIRWALNVDDEEVW